MFIIKFSGDTANGQITNVRQVKSYRHQPDDKIPGAVIIRIIPAESETEETFFLFDKGDEFNAAFVMNEHGKTIEIIRASSGDDK